MYVTLLFWLALLPPGYVLVRALWREDLEAGLLGGIAHSYLATLALLSPVSILCYWLKLPVWVMSATCVAMAVVGLAVITWRRWWGGIAKLIWTSLCLELVIVAADLTLGARTGAFMRGDSKIHVARVRFLLDHGYSNDDPFVTPTHFYPVYHTNLLHGLHAACAKLTGVDVFGEWFTAIVWAKLLFIAGTYTMVWHIFKSRWAAWLTVLLLIGMQGANPLTIYPNKIGAFFLMPLVVGFAAQAAESPTAWRSALKIAMASLVLGQVHPLYAMFAGLAVGPYLLGMLIVRLIARRPGALALTACLAALAAAAPFLLVARAAKVRELEPTAEEVAESPQFIRLENGWVMMRPGGYREWSFLAVGVICGLAGPRRRQAAVLASAAATTLLVLHVPPLCTAALSLLGEPFAVARMAMVVRLAMLGLAPGGLAVLMEPSLRSRWPRALLSLCMLPVGEPLGRSETKFEWPHYIRTAFSGPETRHHWLTVLRSLRECYQARIPSGTTVLANAEVSTWMVMVHDCKVVAPERASYGVADLKEREADLAIMLAPGTPWEERVWLLQRYGIQQYVVRANKPEEAEWTRGHVRQVLGCPEHVVLELIVE